MSSPTSSPQFKTRKKSKVVTGIRPGEEKPYMGPSKSSISEEKSFKNMMALQRVYTEKLNRENAIAAKEKKQQSLIFL